MTSLTLMDDWLHDTYGTGESEEDVVLVRSDDDFSDFTDWLLERRRPLAYDIEATGLDTYSLEWEIKSIQWGDQSKAFVFIWGEPWFQKSIDIVMEKNDYRLLAQLSCFSC